MRYAAPENMSYLGPSSPPQNLFRPHILFHKLPDTEPGAVRLNHKMLYSQQFLFQCVIKRAAPSCIFILLEVGTKRRFKQHKIYYTG